jgi:hypothetical protein
MQVRLQDFNYTFIQYTSTSAIYMYNLQNLIQYPILMQVRLQFLGDGYLLLEPGRNHQLLTLDLSVV